jgi:hypothetical protein
MQNRIGIYNEDGSIKTYPELSLAGQVYDKTQDKLGIGNGRFVILDRFLTADARAELLTKVIGTPVSKDKS